IRYAVGEVSLGMTHFQRAIQLQPENADAYIWLGKGYYLQERFPQAIQFWRRAIAIDPQAVYAYTSLGDLYSQRRDFERAIDYYRQALAQPDQQGIPVGAHALAHNSLGLALQEQGRLQDALREYQESLRLAPDFEPARLNLLQLQERLKEKTPSSPLADNP
ncbi:MAG: tetratricopeptide repeat protein, partial [Cyanobacteriota bacterium]|nr:tetratricopeptide repeat protein [Cyanobacteriota bacterium]